MTKIKKAVIPAAGYGTSFLPATKAQPKELLPIVDKPIIQFTVEEALASGIEEVLIITGKNKREIENHFDSYPELEENLKSKGKLELLELVYNTTKEDIFYVRQSYPKGLGDAIYQAKAFVGDEPFAVMLADNIMESDEPIMNQLIESYNELNSSVVGLTVVPSDQIDQYGIAEVNQVDENHSREGVYNVKSYIEKPQLGSTDSNLAIAGRYILEPEIFDYLADQEPGVGGEIQLTDALERMNKDHTVYGKKLKGRSNNVGDILGFMKMNIRYGLEHPETKDELADYIIELSETLA